MLTLRSDLTVALRSLRRAPAFTATALATLALAIGLNSAVFSLVRGLLLRELPFDSPERLALVWEASSDKARNVVNPGNYLRWTEEAKSFSALSAMAAWSVNLGGNDTQGAERVPIGYVTREFFETAGAPALVGRTFTAADVAEAASNVVVLSEPLWRARGEIAEVGAISWLPLGGTGSATGYRALDQPPPAPEAERGDREQGGDGMG